MSSLPVPLSPKIMTDASVGATRRAIVDRLAERRRVAEQRVAAAGCGAAGLGAQLGGGRSPGARRRLPTAAHGERGGGGGALRPRRVRRAADEHLEVRRRERLRQVVPRAGPQRLEARRDRRIARHDDDERVCGVAAVIARSTSSPPTGVM